MPELFPDLNPIRHGWLPVGDGHSLHWEISGNLKGKPVVWLHGGPGSSASPMHRRFFDPDRFLIIQYDQRGCGSSRSVHPLEQNQTADLVEDLERLRQFFGLNTWSVVGGSWGGALALAYAQKYAFVVEHLLLRSPFLCSPAEIDHFMNHPPAACLTHWQALKSHLPLNSSESLLAFGHRVFCEQNNLVSQSALAMSWSQYESAMNDYPAPAQALQLDSGVSQIPRYQIQCHYLMNHCFVTQDALLAPDNLNRMDITLIHGEDDALCPVTNSEAILAVVPGAKLVRLPGCGHALGTQPMQHAMLGAIASW